MRVAITGGTGFIGRELVGLHLAAGDRVTVLTRRQSPHLPAEVEFHTGDLASAAVNLDPFVRDVDVLYHCSGEIRDVQSMHRLHVEGTRRLLTFAKGRVRRWVQLSSVGVYGTQREGLVTENSIIAPKGPYEETKANSDLLVQSSGIPHCIIRPSIVFGRGMPNNSLRQMVSMIDRGWFFYIGRPGASANYIHAKNVAHCLYLGATVDIAAGNTYNISDYCSMESFVEQIADALGKRAPRLRLPEYLTRAVAATMQNLPGFPLSTSRVDALTTRCRFPIDKAQAELGYTHRIAMSHGIDEIVSEWKRAK